jgi:uncharacterized Zn-binding protein involved in type VI secretion
LSFLYYFSYHLHNFNIGVYPPVRKVMTRPFIVIGDSTSHGGTVVGGAATTDTHGKRIARIGDKVTCPRKGHGGETVVASGDPTVIIDGSPAARHGDLTACGATLISKQFVTGSD